MEEMAVMGYVEACSFIKQYINSTKKTQSQVAKELDISASALSGFLGGTYKAPHTIIAKGTGFRRDQHQQRHHKCNQVFPSAGEDIGHIWGCRYREDNGVQELS